MRNIFLTFCLLVCCAAQAQRTNVSNGQVVGNGTNFSNVVSAGGGGCTPSYGNPTGTGITVFTSPNTFTGQGQSLPVIALATNNVSAANLYFNNGLVLDGSTYFIGFAFNAPTLITEDKYFQQLTTAQGTWKWQGTTSTNGWTPGVNDNSIWTDIGGNFTMVSGTTTTHTTMSGNTVQYKYYRALGMSGSTSFTPFIYQFQFKSCQ